MNQTKDMRSRFERDIARELEWRGIAYKYEAYSYEYDEPVKQRQARCLDCEGTNLVRTAWYTPDFFLPSGIIIEAKGRFTAADRRKIIACREFHEELHDNLVMLFMRDNRIHKNSKTTYSQWCEANQVPYSVGELKEEWLK